MRKIAPALCLMLAGCGSLSGAWPWGDPQERLRAKAAQEGHLVIWSTTDRPVVAALLADFQALNPRIRIDYRDMPALAVHDLVEQHAKAGTPLPDFVWSSAMDLQIKLVNDGYAQRYASPEGAAIPDWANWKDKAWGLTSEPIVIVYNRRLLPRALAPTSHIDLLHLLERRLPQLQGRVATYDVSHSAVGYLALSQDEEASRLAWPIVRALGANGVRLFPTSEGIISDVSAGRSVVGYNVVGSYAIAGMRRNPDLAVVLPTDYTLLASRIAIIPTKARHPNAARIFLDYLLSRRGQRHLATEAMPPVRRDLDVPPSLRTSEQDRRVIKVGPSLLVIQDKLSRVRFLNEWWRNICGRRYATGFNTSMLRARAADSGGTECVSE